MIAEAQVNPVEFAVPQNISSGLVAKATLDKTP
jgi:hypothetical protein